MQNGATHYQTSFKVKNSDGEAFKRLKAAVYGWVLKKEPDRSLKDRKADFFYRGHWPNLFQTHSSLSVETYRSDKEGDAWAIHYTEVDRDHGQKRFWYSDIGLKSGGEVVIVSLRVSFAWNTEYLDHEPETPFPTVPEVVRYILKGNTVFSGRPEFRLVERPIRFDKPDSGKALCDFIQSPERRYPLIVFNGDSTVHRSEAEGLARQLTGKCQVVVIANIEDLAQEIQHYLPEDYWVQSERLRVFFPFNGRHNSPERHRWYNAMRPDYAEQRQGMIHGLLRHHSLTEEGAVESIDDIRRLITRENLIRLRDSTPEHQKELAEFFALYELVEKERDRFKQEAASYAAEIDQKEEEVNRLKWECTTYQSKLKGLGPDLGPVDVSTLLPTLPTNLRQVGEAAGRFFPHLTITEDALKAAEDYSECKSVQEAWEMFLHLNETMFRLKFKEGEKDLERKFKNETGYELAMTEGPNTKKDKRLMGLRRINDGRDYDITPHVKHGNREPKCVRIYFAFDEDGRKIVVGHIGRHIPNATTKTL